jgi:ribosome biogenesis GTPase
MKGRVIKSTGSWYQVRTETHVLAARLKGKFKQEDLKLTNPIAVGDWVELGLEQGQETALITEILPRENYVIRKSTRKQQHTHILASNLDQALLVITVKNPRTSLGFIDRFLVATESYGIPTSLVINKMDQIEGKEEVAWVKEIQSIYPALGYPVIVLSALHAPEVQAKLLPLIQGKSNLISGHSGVGKSTLLNALVSHAKQQTQEISAFSAKGVHTTTFAELFYLPESGDIIDTPGIKEFGILNVEKEELSHFFPEMRALLGQCRYHNCTHINEPGCRVLKSLEEGLIPAQRYQSYVNILHEEDSHR